MADIQRVGVLGCGLMGSGIAQVAASVGYDTVVRDVSRELLDRGRAGIEKSLAKFVEKGKLQATDRDDTLKRLTFTTTVADLKSSDIVIEAITEDLALKQAAAADAEVLGGPQQPRLGVGQRQEHRRRPHLLAALAVDVDDLGLELDQRLSPRGGRPEPEDLSSVHGP